MILFYSIFCACVFFCATSECSEIEIRTEGIWSVPKNPTFQWTLEKVIDCFLPFDPVILELYGSEGASSQLFAQQFPKGKVITCDSSTLPHNSDFLDKLFDVHLIRLDTSKYDFLLQNRNLSLFNKIYVYSIKTDFSSMNHKANFYRLKHFLKAKGYILICLWYHKASRGEAVFIQKSIYNAVFQ